MEKFEESAGERCSKESVIGATGFLEIWGAERL
jgi:hypothetical protein